MNNQFSSVANGFLSIGLMSGTSLDGIDGAIIYTDGLGEVKHISNESIPYSQELKNKIKEAMRIAKSKKSKSSSIPEVNNVEKDLTKLHAQLVSYILERENIPKEKIDVIGFHGQTIFHAPENGYTWQIGNGQMLANLTNIDVINDFRTEDMNYGGQGAPLVPLYHLALFKANLLKSPIAFLNIGGVSNITYIGSDGGDCLLGFDLGPGNALLDDWIYKNTGFPFDDSGKIAASGQVNDQILQKLMDNDYYNIPPPKSIDRDTFDVSLINTLSKSDGASTLTAFTVESIYSSLDHLPEAPSKWIVTGGGRHNDFLMQSLKEKLEVDVLKIDELGVNGDAIEAEAFAYLAVRAKKGLPLTLPEITGVDMPRSGGAYFKAL